MAVTGSDLVELARIVFDRRRALITLVGPADAASVAKLERLLGRPAGSSVWLGEDDEKKRKPRLRAI